MKMSVSTRMSATVPIIATGNGSIGIRAEGRRQGSTRVALRLQVGVEGATHHLGKGHSLVPGHLIDHPTLILGEVDLRPGRRHTAALYSTEVTSSGVPSPPTGTPPLTYWFPVELRGFEPLTPCMPCKCSAS